MGPSMLIAENHTASSATRESSDTALERMLKRISRSDEFPSISRYLIEINQKLSSNPDASDASELANIILNDYALTSKLLKLVRKGREVVLTDRGEPVGKIVPIEAETLPLAARIHRLESQGVIEPGQHKEPRKIPLPIPVPDDLAQRILSEDRDGGR